MKQTNILVINSMSAHRLTRAGTGLEYPGKGSTRGTHGVLTGSGTGRALIKGRWS